MSPLRSSIGSSFFKHSRVQFPDLDSVRQRPAVGLDSAVRCSFAEQTSVVPNVGVTGWSFVQNGLNYACRIKDDDNNDVYGFGVGFPEGKPYLHRFKQMCIAEKAHVLSVVEQLMSCNKRQQHLRALYELEKACFDPSSGIVQKGSAGAHRKPALPVGQVTGYCGLVFADDSDFLKPAEPTMLALEWEKGGRLYFIDCSSIIPSYQFGYAANPNLQRVNMNRSEAKEAVKYARAMLEVSDKEQARICRVTNLWERLEAMAEWLPVVREPSYP